MNAVASSVIRTDMDRAFIEKNQIVERYLAGKLPPRGIVDFENYCRENPDFVEGMGLANRVNAAVRLLSASGQPEPWHQKPQQFWEKQPFIASVAAAALIFLILSIVLWSRLGTAEKQIGALETAVIEKPLDPASTRRSIKISPSRTGMPAASMFGIGGRDTEFVEMKVDLSWAKTNNFRVSLDRIGFSGIAIWHNLQRDSNGELRISLNSSVLGPGDYTLLIEGLDWRGTASPTAFARFAVRLPR